MPTLEFVTLKLKRTKNKDSIVLIGSVSNHPSFEDGKNIHTSPIVFFDEYVNMVRTKSGTCYYLQADFDNDVKYKLFRSMARKNKITNNLTYK